MSESVDHPKHYTFGNIEVIDAIEDWQLNYHRGNAVKYIARAGKKNDELEDLKKARWYLEREIQRLQNNNSSGFHIGDCVSYIEQGKIGYVVACRGDEVVVTFPDGKYTIDAQKLVKL